MWFPLLTAPLSVNKNKLVLLRVQGLGEAQVQPRDWLKWVRVNSVSVICCGSHSKQRGLVCLSERPGWRCSQWSLQCPATSCHELLSAKTWYIMIHMCRSYQANANNILNDNSLSLTHTLSVSLTHTLFFFYLGNLKSSLHIEVERPKSKKRIHG